MLPRCTDVLAEMDGSGKGDCLAKFRARGESVNSEKGQKELTQVELIAKFSLLLESNSTVHSVLLFLISGDGIGRWNGFFLGFFWKTCIIIIKQFCMYIVSFCNRISGHE